MPDSKIDIANQLDLDLGSVGVSGTGLDTLTIDTSTYAITGGGSGSTISWSQNYNNWTTTSNVNIHSDGITMKEGSDIKVGDKSLINAIEKIEERLGILVPNPDLEQRWDQLKELRKQYVELEKDLLEKEKLMKILKEK